VARGVRAGNIHAVILARSTANILADSGDDRSEEEDEGGDKWNVTKKRTRTQTHLFYGGYIKE
jgi:hypothetical protein